MALRAVTLAVNQRGRPRLPKLGYIHSGQSTFPLYVASATMRLPKHIPVGPHWRLLIYQVPFEARSKL